MYKPIKILGVDFEYDPDHMTDAEHEILEFIERQNKDPDKFDQDVVDKKYLLITNESYCEILGTDEYEELKRWILEAENEDQVYVFLVFKDKKSISYKYEKIESVILGD